MESPADRGVEQKSKKICLTGKCLAGCICLGANQHVPRFEVFKYKGKIKLKLVFTLAAVLLLLVGLGMTVATRTMLGNFGHEANSGSLHFARATGGAALGFAVMTWLMRNSGPSQARNAFVAGLSLFFFLEAVVDFRAIMNGTYGPDAWFTGVIPWLVFLVLTIYAARSEMSESTN